MMLRAALLIVALVFSSASIAQQRYAVPGHGTLVLPVPAAWRAADKPLQNPPAIALVMLPATDDSFNLQLTAIWLGPAKRADLTPQAIRDRVQASSRELLSSSVEGEAKLVELRGTEALGYYYSLTDRETKNTAGDYKYIAQGMATVGEVLVIFTFLHRELETAAKQQALQMLADAAYVKGAPAAEQPK